MPEIALDLNMTRLTTQAVLYLPRLVSGLIIFIVFWLAAHVIQRIILKVGSKSKVGAEILELARKVVKVLVLTFGALTALGTLGINVSALVAGLGLTGFALGFALRDAISNLLAGVLVLFYRTFKVNDNITVAGFEGVVTDVDLRYTTLRFEDTKILIPNATLFTNPIKLVEAKKAPECEKAKEEMVSNA